MDGLCYRKCDTQLNEFTKPSEVNIEKYRGVLTEASLEISKCTHALIGGKVDDNAALNQHA